MWQERVSYFLNTDYTLDVDWQITSTILQEVQNYRMKNPNQGVNLELFLRIAKWKLRGQYGRNKNRLHSLSEENIIEVTKSAIKITPYIPKNCLLDVQMTLLMCLSGTGIGLASAFLTLYYPEKYGIIDFRTWDEINNVSLNEARTNRVFTLRDYKLYNAQIEKYANEKGISVQSVDFALWKTWELRRRNLDAF